jgi:hypothetical protein
MRRCKWLLINPAAAGGENSSAFQWVSLWLTGMRRPWIFVSHRRKFPVPEGHIEGFKCRFARSSQ